MQTRPHARRVLIVDHDRDAAATSAWLLLNKGYGVEFAIDGAGALEVARRFRPGIIFLDLALPDIDWSDLARGLKRALEPENVRIFALTAYAGDSERRRSMQAGCEAHLVKPLDPGVLDRLLENAKQFRR